MQHRVVLKILGVLLSLFSSTLLPPAFVAWLYNENSVYAFLLSAGVALSAGIACWWPVRKFRKELRFRDGFLIVVLFWTVLAAFGALPFITSSEIEIRITDAFFESMSGLTTTGATVLTNLDTLPKSLLFYRQQLQWLGGMGIIVLAVAVMPMLGVGGMQLYLAETPGPLKNSKLTPRITQTAKALWFIYAGLTALCAMAYYASGMSLFDAICHSFSTVAIGGFSTHDASLGYFGSINIYAVSSIFMIISSLNFGLHFMAFRSRRFNSYLHDPEARVFFLLIFVSIVICVVTLTHFNAYDSFTDTLAQGTFQVISIATTTGFTSTGFSWWPTFLPIMLILLSAVGGCAGSTSGGIKVIRTILLFKQGRREIHQLIHPQAVIPIKLGSKPVPEQVINAVCGFLALYILSYVVLSLLMTATGLDPVSAFSAVTACLNNLGPGLGAVAQNYASVSDSGKWILAGTMLLGRLELFTLLVLFSRHYWRS